ncbi:hypothetical protein ACFL20_08935, partial [Spirochaetota bacterium]
LNDPTSKVSKLAKGKNAFRLVHTVDDKNPSRQKELKKIKKYPNPKVYYISGKTWIKEMMKFKKKEK